MAILARVDDQLEAHAGTDLAPPEAVRSARRHAALAGATKLGVPALGMVLALSYGLGLLGPWLEAFLVDTSVAGLLALFFATCFLGPALLALPLATLAVRVTRRAARAGEDLGLAAAAGAGVATAGVTFGWVVARAHSFTELLIAVPMMVAAAVLSGLVGWAAFSALPSPRRRRRVDRVPALYRALVGAGAGGTVLFLAASLWVLAAQLVPSLGMHWMAAWLPAWSGTLAAHALTLALLAPASYLSARLLAPGTGRRTALGVGLMGPVMVPMVSKLGFAMLYGGVVPNPYLPMVLGYLLGALPHALAIRAGLGAPRERPRLSAGAEIPELA